MSNILDIGRSGLLAYRTALAVTAENIANVGTDGYRRRDVSTITAGGGQSTSTTLPTGGQGVTVTDVRRAFDDLAAERARGASASQSAATAHLAGARAIETLMIPGDDGIDGTLRTFFDSLSKLAGNPTDTVSRALTLGSGQMAAEAVSGLATGLAGLRTDLLQEAAGAASAAQGLLRDLADVSSRIGGIAVKGPAASAVHPLADRRDALLDELSRLLPVSVTLGEDQRPTVRFGSAAGPLLLQGTRTAAFSVAASDQLTLRIETPDGATRDTRMLTSGRIGGLSRAMGALDMAAGELDAFARTLSRTMNSVHRGGIDQTGTAGGDLFRTDGWDVRPATANSGALQIDVSTTATTAARDAFNLVFDGSAGLWRAHGADGAEIAAGADRLVLPGATVDVAGPAVDGDRITLTPTEGRAADLRLAVTDPARLAAASAFSTTASPANVGSASMSALVTGVAASPIPGLAGLVGTAAVDVPPGVVGMIPAGTGAVTLSSLGRSATTTLPPLPGATRLDLALGTDADGFDLAGLADATAIAAALNGGSRLSDTGQSLASLGLAASVAEGGGLILSRPGAPLAAGATLTGPGGSVTGVESSADAPGGMLQVITRNGRHVAGTPLTATEIASLMTPANGFLPGAVYDPSPLTEAGGTGYRGTKIDRLALPGLQSAKMAAGGLDAQAELPFSTAPARSLTLSDASGAASRMDLPAGASAALIAARIGSALPGVSATATTGLELRGFAAGPVSFAMTGANGTPLQVSALLSGANAAPLAQAVNALSGATGIRAELSPDGARLLLVEGGGDTITLSGLVAAAGMTAASAGADGAVTGTASAWTPGTAIRQAGTVEITAVQTFTLVDGATPITSAIGDGAVDVQTSAAGAAARVTFRAVPAIAEGGLLHRLSLGGQMFEAAVPAGTGAAATTAAMARALRAGAPDATLTGQPLATLPPEGSALTVRVDGATHTVRMQGGLPVISGPEAGRVSARFDPSNRLIVEARGVTDGTGIGLEPSAAFGLAPGAGVLTLTGQAPGPAGLPATLAVSVGGADHLLTLGTDGALTLPPGFPGTASRDPVNGALRLELAAPATDLSVAVSAAAGFGGPGAAVQVEGATLRLSGRGAPLGVRADVRGSLAQSLSLTNLPPEDMVVALTGTGTLRLAGAVTPGGGKSGPGALNLQVIDAETGRVALTDAVTGHRVSEGALDGSGRVALAGLTLQLTGRPVTGDRFGILPAGPGSANADTALALAALRNPDATTGSPGLTERFNRLQGDTGLRAAAAGRSLATATAAAEASEREQAAIGAVDLDTEAARLLELQQGYQASAQAVSVARDLFATLLQMF